VLPRICAIPPTKNRRTNGQREGQDHGDEGTDHGADDQEPDAIAGMGHDLEAMFHHRVAIEVAQIPVIGPEKVELVILDAGHE